MNTSDFNFIFLGQSVLKYKVPLDVFHTINDIYEKKIKELHPANKQLDECNQPTHRGRHRFI